MLKCLQKLTLIDYPGKLACTIFLYGCNFRCGFCHNPELVLTPTEERYSEEEILKFLEKRKAQLDGVCFTGGEPLLSLRKEFVKRVKEIGYAIKIDTNGSNPEKLKELINENLVDYIAMDLKASPEKYVEVVNAQVPLEKLEETIKIMVSYGGDYEFRTTILKRFHNEDDLEKMFKWILGLTRGVKPKRYFLQGFVNKGKLLDNTFKSEPDVYEDYLGKLKKVADNYFESVGVRV